MRQGARQVHSLLLPLPNMVEVACDFKKWSPKLACFALKYTWGFEGGRAPLLLHHAICSMMTKIVKIYVMHISFHTGF